MTDFAVAEDNDLEELAAATIANVEHVFLTVDELATISLDLDLAVALDGGVSSGSAAVDFEAARRSLASKGLVHATDHGPVLSPWLTLMAEVVGDPFAVVRMKRQTPEESWEWTLFVNQFLGVQQQSSEDGVAAWAPFAVQDVFDIMIEALALHDVDPGPDSMEFLTSWSELSDIDRMVAAGETLSLASRSIPARYLDGAQANETSTQMVLILDRTVEPPRSYELVWAGFGEDYWQLDAGALAAQDDVPARVRLVSGEAIFRELASALSAADSTINEGERSP